MTITEFRNNPALRKELLDALQNAALTQAMACIEAEDHGVDAKLNADPIVSVRMSSQRAGREIAFKSLYEMTQPLPLDEAPPVVTFGTKYDESAFDPQPEESTTT